MIRVKHEAANGKRDHTVSASTDPLKEQTVRCNRCAHTVPSTSMRCPHCGAELFPTITPVTVPIVRRPLSIPVSNGHLSHYFGEDSRLIIQFLPSGVCVPVHLTGPLVLGREDGGTMDEVLDLSEFNATKHGVSRRHAMLRREDDRLVVNDLGSTNGTHLNGSLLLPHEDYPLAHGDKLILGTLHLLISFSTLASEPGDGR